MTTYPAASLTLAALIAAAPAAQAKTKAPSCVEHAGKTWCIADKAHAFGLTLKHLNAKYPPSGIATTRRDIVEVDDADHTTFVACGWEYYHGEVGPQPFVWIDATGFYDSGPGAAVLCPRYGVDIEPGFSINDLEPGYREKLLRRLPK